jgi:hypothetical protein
MTVIFKSHSMKLLISNWEETFLFTYIHTYIPPYRHGAISMSQMQQNVEQVINVHNFYSVKYYQHFTNQYYRSS